MSGGAFPTQRQELLLRAALLEGDGAARAFAAFAEAVDLVTDPLDEATLRLLPLVWRNLAGTGFEHPLLPRLKGVYRYWWLRNQAVFRDAADVLGRLRERGIPTLVLKGAALSVLYYRDPGARPMSDLDVLVPADRAVEAMDRLAAGGWTAPARARLPFRHASLLVRGGDRQCDLHWHALADALDGGLDEELWSGSREIEVAGERTRALAPGDSLFLAAAHGLRPNPLAPVRWVADAVMILRVAGADIDAVRLASLAERGGFVLRVRAALRWLGERLGVPVPAGALERLEAAPVSGLERLESRWPGARGLRFLLLDWLRSTRGRGVPGRMAALPTFLRERLEVASRRHLPAELLRRAARRVRRGAAAGGPR